MRLRTLVLVRERRCVFALVLASGGCFGAVRDDDAVVGGGAGGNAAPSSSTPDGRSTIPPKAESAGPGAVIISLQEVDDDGAVAADDANVYWNQLDSSGSFDLLSCPNSGCAAAGPTTLASSVYAGSVVGEILPVAGRVFFQTEAGEVVDCASSGCEGGPTVFVGRTGSHAALATDGAEIYWFSQEALYSCPIGATCSAPRALAPASASQQIVPSGGRLYWVEASGALSTVPVDGGQLTVLCNVPWVSSGYFAQGSLAVVDGYAYVSAGLQMNGGGGGLFRCPLSGGEATAYATDPVAMFVETDGESLFWMSGEPGAVAQIYSCAPGSSCASPVTFLAPTPYLDGFAVAGSFVYSVSSTLQRTTKM